LKPSRPSPCKPSASRGPKNILALLEDEQAAMAWVEGAGASRALTFATILRSPPPAGLLPDTGARFCVTTGGRRLRRAGSRHWRVLLGTRCQNGLRRDAAARPLRPVRGCVRNRPTTEGRLLLIRRTHARLANQADAERAVCRASDGGIFRTGGDGGRGLALLSAGTLFNKMSVSRDSARLWSVSGFGF